MIVLTSLLLAALPTLPCPSQEFTVWSEDGSHVARIAQLADDPRPARRELWQLIVLADRGARGERRLWSVICPEPDAARTYLLANDGSSLCVVDPRFDPEADLVEIWRKGRRAGGLGAKELALQLDEEALRADTPVWIAPSSGTLRTREMKYGTSSSMSLLDLLALDGGLRTVNLSNNRVVVSADADGTSIGIQPTVPTDLKAPLQKVYIRSWSAPEEVPGATGLAVRIRGSFPTAGWRVVGFGLDVVEPEAERPLIVVTPYAIRVSEGGLAQVITNFDESCTLNIARAGRYRLEVHGRDTPEITRTVEVLPTVLFVSLQMSGGIAGIEREIVAHKDGRLSNGEQVTLVPTDAFAELVTFVGLLPTEPRIERSQGNDFFQYDLTWVVNDKVIRATFDDGTLISPWRDVVHLLLALADGQAAAPAPAVPGYRIDAAASTFLVRTGAAGLLKPLSHTHTIRVRNFEGEIFADPSSIEDAVVTLFIDASSLSVIDEESEGDQRAIDKKMHEDVLGSRKHTEIIFSSTKISAKHLGEGRFETVIDGDLALRGERRKVKLSTLVEFTDGGLTARGKASLKLSDFGIRAPKALGGTINVADKVELRFDLVAR